MMGLYLVAVVVEQKTLPTTVCGIAWRAFVSEVFKK